MLEVVKEGILLSPSKLTFENNGVLNPGVYQDGDDIHIFYRAVEDGNFSTIGYAKMNGPTHVVERHNRPLIGRDFEYEKHGVEDARVVKIEETYYMTYTAYDGVNAMGALAISKDLKHWEKKGIITPPVNYKEYKYNLECCNQQLLNPKYHYYYYLFSDIGMMDNDRILVRDKDIVLFPRKIDGKFVMLHRLWPGIQIVKFDNWEDLTKDFWTAYLRDLTSHIVLDPLYGFEVNYVGAGCPPIETEDGWLIIYHGVCETTIGKTYHAAAALLDRHKPEQVIARLRQPLFSPTEKWELEGVVNYVVFPTGSAIFGKELYIFYGAADKHTAIARLNINDLLKELRKQI
ncbi:MAG: pesticidal protein Cry7Aa [Cyclobacteriaceae bacterium]|nr:pesticidal protein Cry7Aa [Cyclobacteriaceae bacterium]